MVPQLNLAEFAAWKEASGMPVVLDVREPWELQTASVKADGFRLLHVPMREIVQRLPELQEAGLLDPVKPVGCLCHHGMRSLQVANFLAQAGYSEVVNLQGGIDAWTTQVDPSVPRY